MNQVPESEQIMLTMEQAKEKIALKDAMDRLFKNRDFKKVFVEGYFKKQVIALVMRKASPGMQADAHQKFIIAQLDAMGHVNQYIMMLNQEGREAQMALGNAEAEYEDALAEEA